MTALDAVEVPALFHWSPSSRRKGIERRGLVPGSLAIDRKWRPPYIALAPSPEAAWQMSGEDERGAGHPSWDLWQVWLSNVGAEAIPYDDGSAREFRVYERIYRRDLWLVGTRQRDEP